MDAQLTMDEQLDKKFKAIGRFNANRQREYIAAGYDPKTSYAMACADFVSEYPDYGFKTGEDVKSWYWAYKHAAYPAKQSDNGGEECAADTRGLGPTALYRLWLQDHNSVGCDAELAHFTGYTDKAFSYARAQLRDDGWEIEKNKNRWIVVSRPENDELRQKIDTLESELAALNEMLAELRSQV